MRFGKQRVPTGAIGFASIAAGVAIFLANFALPLTPSVGEVFIMLGGLAFVGGWIFLFVWLIKGYRRQVTLRHTVRVGLWLAAGIFLTVAASQFWSGLTRTGLREVSWELLVFFLAISAAFAAAGWREWESRSSAAKRADNRDYDDWDWGNAVHGGDGFDVDFDMD